MTRKGKLIFIYSNAETARTNRHYMQSIKERVPGSDHQMGTMKMPLTRIKLQYFI